MITTFYPPFSFGGDAISVQRLSHALVRRGHEVTVVHDVDAYLTLHRGPAPEYRENDDDEGVRVIRLRSRWGALSPLLVHQFGRPVLHRRRLRRLLQDGDFDVVHFHNVSLIGGPGILAWPTQAVTLYTAREHWLVCPTHVLWRNNREPCDRRECLGCTLRHRRPPQWWRYTGMLPRALRQIDVVMALSEFSRAKHREFGLERDMAVLPNFRPEGLPEPAESSDSPHPRPYFFFAGRLEAIKGLDDVLPVFRAFGGADLLVAGEGTHEAALRRLAGNAPSIRFLGRLAPEMLPRYYRHAVAALVPSVAFETFGAVLLEAMAEGTPVVARRVGPFPEIIARSGAGELFDTAEDLRGVLERLTNDPVHRAALARRARPAVAEHWSESVILPRYLELIRDAADRRAPNLRPAARRAGAPVPVG